MEIEGGGADSLCKYSRLYIVPKDLYPMMHSMHFAQTPLRRPLCTQACHVSCLISQSYPRDQALRDASYCAKRMMNLKLVVNAGSLTTISSPSDRSSPSLRSRLPSVCLRKLSGEEKYSVLSALLMLGFFSCV